MSQSKNSTNQENVRGFVPMNKRNDFKEDTVQNSYGNSGSSGSYNKPAYQANPNPMTHSITCTAKDAEETMKDLVVSDSNRASKALSGHTKSTTSSKTIKIKKANLDFNRILSESNESLDDVLPSYIQENPGYVQMCMIDSIRENLGLPTLYNVANNCDTVGKKVYEYVSQLARVSVLTKYIMTLSMRCNLSKDITINDLHSSLATLCIKTIGQDNEYYLKFLNLVESSSKVIRRLATYPSAIAYWLHDEILTFDFAYRRELTDLLDQVEEFESKCYEGKTDDKADEMRLNVLLVKVMWSYSIRTMILLNSNPRLSVAELLGKSRILPRGKVREDLTEEEEMAVLKDNPARDMAFRLANIAKSKIKSFV